MVLQAAKSIAGSGGPEQDRDDVIFGATAIPREAWPGDNLFRLTSSADRAEQAIKAARNVSGHWSGEQFLRVAPAAAVDHRRLHHVFEPHGNTACADKTAAAARNMLLLYRPGLLGHRHAAHRAPTPFRSHPAAAYSAGRSAKRSRIPGSTNL